MVYLLKKFKKLFIITALIAGIVHYSVAHGVETWQNPQTWKNLDIATYLQNAPIISQEPMTTYLHQNGFEADFSNEVYVVTLANGSKAVFKPIPNPENHSAYAEEAAYKASVVLSFPYIPPTIIRTIGNQTGSLQLFVTPDVDLLKEGAFLSFLQQIDEEAFALLKIFYFVFGQWDTGAHNLLSIKQNTKTVPICIDNAGIKDIQIGHYGQMPFVAVYPNNPIITHLPSVPEKIDQASSLLESNLSYGTLEHLDPIAKDPSLNKRRRFFSAQKILWCQHYYYYEEEDAILPFSDFLPTKARKALQKLDLKPLKTIFTEEAQKRFASPLYLNTILQRRDEVLAYHTAPQI